MSQTGLPATRYRFLSGLQAQLSSSVYSLATPKIKTKGYFGEQEDTTAQLMSQAVYSLQAHQSGCLQQED